MPALSIEEKLVLAGLTVLGKSFSVPAYLMTHPKVSPDSVKPESLVKMASRWLCRSESKQFRKECAGRMGAAMDEEGAAMTDSEIMQELTRAARTEPDQSKKSQILMRVAEMKNRLAESEQSNEAKRVVLYLPFNCDCRQCELFRRERERLMNIKSKEDEQER